MKPDKHYRHYGGRGIENRYPDLVAFIADVGRAPSARHTIDRIDNDGHYEPGNCRWITREEQRRNRRDTLRAEHNGKTQCLAEWSRELGIPLDTLQYRYHCGLRGEELLKPHTPRVPASVEYMGRTQTLTQWARELGIKRGTLKARYDRGARGESLFRTLGES
jgi:hypothetical protein